MLDLVQALHVGCCRGSSCWMSSSCQTLYGFFVLALGQVLHIGRCMGVDKCGMTCIHHRDITQSIFTALDILHVLPFSCLHPLGPQKSFYCVHSCACSRTSQSWNHAEPLQPSFFYLVLLHFLQLAKTLRVGFFFFFGIFFHKKNWSIIFLSYFHEDLLAVLCKCQKIYIWEFFSPFLFSESSFNIWAVSFLSIQWITPVNSHGCAISFLNTDPAFLVDAGSSLFSSFSYVSLVNWVSEC